MAQCYVWINHPKHGILAELGNYAEHSFIFDHLFSPARKLYLECLGKGYAWKTSKRNITVNTEHYDSWQDRYEEAKWVDNATRDEVCRVIGGTLSKKMKASCVEEL